MRFLLFWVIFVRFGAFFCVLVGCCTLLRVFAYFSALGVPLVALGTLLGALGTLLGRSWGALWALLGSLGTVLCWYVAAAQFSSIFAADLGSIWEAKKGPKMEPKRSPKRSNIEAKNQHEK